MENWLLTFEYFFKYNRVAGDFHNNSIEDVKMKTLITGAISATLVMGALAMVPVASADCNGPAASADCNGPAAREIIDFRVPQERATPNIDPIWLGPSNPVGPKAKNYKRNSTMSLKCNAVDIGVS